MGRTPVLTIAGMALVAALAGCQQTGTNKQPFRPMELGLKQKPNPAVAQGGNPQPLNQAYNPNTQQQGVFGQQQGVLQPSNPGVPGQPINPLHSANGNPTAPNRQEHFTTPLHQPTPGGDLIPTSGPGLAPGTVVPATTLPASGPALGPLNPQPIPQPVNPYNPGSAPGQFPVSQNSGAFHDLPVPPAPRQPVATTGDTITLPPTPPPFPMQNSHYAPGGSPQLPPVDLPLPVTPLSSGPN